MTISSPLKQASYPLALKNHELNSVGALMRCLTQGFGSNPDIYGSGGHNGLDFSYEDGTELFAPVNGFAYFKEESQGYGRYLTFIGEGYKIVYAHLKERLVPDGQVTRGQLVAKGNSTGFSSGHHLHITVKKIDSNGNVLDRDNGHDGAIDPTKYLAWFDMLTKKQVERLQALEGFSDPEGVKYWEGKELDQYLVARIPDKITELTKSLNEQ